MSPPIPDLRPAPYVACHSFLPASMPSLVLSSKSSLAPQVACLCAGSQRTQPQSWPLALTSLSRMGLPIRETCGTSETLGKSVHGNDFGKRSLFLSVPARTYLREKKSICISPFSFLPWPTSSGLNIALSTCAVLELSRILLQASCWELCLWVWYLVD